MQSPDPRRESALVGDLSAGDCLDHAFLRGRRTWTGPARVLALVAIAVAAGVGAVAWMLLRQDLIVSGGNLISARTLWLLSLARLVQLALYGVLGLVVARQTWCDLRGPLDPPPDASATITAALRLLPLWIVLILAPQLLILSPTLLAGETSLIPAEAVLGLQPYHWPVLILWLLLPPFVRCAPAVLATEGGGALRALFRSGALVARSQGRAHQLQGLAALLVAATGAGLAVVLHSLFPDPALDRIDSTWAGLSLGTSTVVALVAGLPIAEALWMPQIQTAWCLCDVDTRVRLEGLDVERAGRLAGLLEAEARS